MKLNKVLLSAATVLGFTAATAVAANADSVTVKAGDTLSHIALENNTTVEALQKLNNLADINFILPGQTIELDGEATTEEQTSTQTTQADANAQAVANVQAYYAQQQAAAKAAQEQQAQAAAQQQAQAAVAAQQAQEQQARATAQAQAAAQQQAQVAAQRQAAAQQAAVAAQQAQQSTTTVQTSTTSSTSEEAARAWIANKESGGSYTARNGQYIGKYQLSASYLNGDYSAENQERVANNYVTSRYGSWANAKSHWEQKGWY